MYQKDNWKNLDGKKKIEKNRTRYRTDSYSGKGRPKDEDYVDVKKIVGRGFVNYEVADDSNE